MNGQYWLVLCVEKDDEHIEEAIDELRQYMDGGAYSESRGGSNYRNSGGGSAYRNNPIDRMSRRDRELYEMGMRDSMNQREREIYEMGRRDAYGRNGAENLRNRENF